MNAVTFVILAAFALLFVSTFVHYLRRRDALSRDVMLIFGSVASLFVIAGAGALVGDLPRFVVGASVAILLAQPLLTLRVVHRIRPVPVWVWGAAAAGYAATALPLAVFGGDADRALTVAGVLVFAATDLAAAYFLTDEARARVGAARARLFCAAGASAALALALPVLSVLPETSVSEVLGRLLALVAVGLYLLAFLPPRWLRRTWSALATYAFTNELINAPAGETPSELWGRTAELTRRMTGAAASLVVAGEEATILAMAGMDAAYPRQASLPAVPDSRDGLRAATRDDDPLDRLARQLHAPFISVVPFGSASSRGALVLMRERPSLFAADDRDIVTSLVRRAAIFAERAEALSQQAALADRLSQTVAALEQASQAKSDFLASMSHELRTPLSAIIGFAALMRDEPLEGDRRSVPDEWIQHVHRSGDHLLALINDVLDLTKIEAGRIELQRERFDLAAALGESVEGLRPLADRKRISVRLSAESGAIEADRGRIRQIVYNLLSNAIKFTPDGGQVDVEARFAGSDVTVAVTDTGVGIAAEDLERVFEEFSQVGDIKAREAGTGLGLALTRRLVEAHGGHVAVTSEPGRGARFEVVLPGARAESAGRAIAEPAVPHAASADAATVLLVEDDPGAVRLLRTYLEGEGYEVLVSASGEAGIDLARTAKPAAILLDVLLPGIDGWEVLRRLKADAELREIPVMVVTVVDERNVAMTLGAVDYFLKPVDPQALLSRLGQYTFTTKVKQRRVRVMAVDDDPAARALVVNTLGAEGFDVFAAASGEEAVRLAMEEPPELVICDLVMPDMDGYEVVNRLHAAEATKDATILILTGHQLSVADRERLNGKVADVIAKGGNLRPALTAWLDRAAAAARRRNTGVQSHVVSRTPAPG